jgi:hypothetical protein
MRIVIAIIYILAFWAFLNAKAHGCPAAFTGGNENSSIIKMDFKSDIKTQILDLLDKDGIAVKNKNDLRPRDAIYQFLNVKARQIPKRNYKIYSSKTLDAKFSTLSADLQNGIRTVMAKALEGEDLNPHLSTRIKKASYSDALYNDWKIHHLHLGTGLRTDGFIERTGDLLYAMVIGEHLLFIDVLDHSPVEGFANRHLLNIVHETWPAAIKPYKLEGIEVVDPITKNADVDALRKSGLNIAFVAEDGTTYMSPGGGLSLSGSNFEFSRRSMILEIYLKNLESDMRESAADIAAHIEKETGKKPAEIYFKIFLEGNHIQVIEEHSELAIGDPIEFFR